MYVSANTTQPVWTVFNMFLEITSANVIMKWREQHKAGCPIRVEQEGMCSSSVVCGFKASVFVKRTDARSSYGLLKPRPPSHWCTSTIRHAPLPLFHRTRPSSRHTKNKQGSVFCSSVMWKRQSYFLSSAPHESSLTPVGGETENKLPPSNLILNIFPPLRVIFLSPAPKSG